MRSCCEYADAVGTQRQLERLAFANIELADLVEREEHRERLAFELEYLQLGEAMPAEELDLGDLPAHAVGFALQRALHYAILGPQIEAHAAAGLVGRAVGPVSCLQREPPRAVLARPGGHRVEHVDAADEIGDERAGGHLV